MAPSFLRGRILCLVAVSIAGLGGRALPAAESERMSGDDPKIHGIFETELPRTEWRHHLRLIIHPHFGDFTQRDYLRIPVGFRYGLTERWEAAAEADAYFAHGLGDVSFGSRMGFSGVRLSTKYRWEEWPTPQIATAMGLSVSSPVGSPPPQVTDGLRHFTPFLSFAHTLETRPDFTTFVSFGYDAVSRTSVKGERRKNAFVDDSWSITPGFVWHRGAFHYTCEVGVASSVGVASNSATVFLVRPAVTWELPQSLTFGSEGRWVFGLGLRAGFGPDGTDLGVSGKIRGDFDFRRVFSSSRLRLPANRSVKRE